MKIFENKNLTKNKINKIHHPIIGSIRQCQPWTYRSINKPTFWRFTPRLNKYYNYNKFINKKHWVAKTPFFLNLASIKIATLQTDTFFKKVALNGRSSEKSEKITKPYTSLKRSNILKYGRPSTYTNNRLTKIIRNATHLDLYEFRNVSDYKIYLIWKYKVVAIVNFFFIDHKDFKTNVSGGAGSGQTYGGYKGFLTNYSHGTVFIANNRRVLGAIKSVTTHVQNVTKNTRDLGLPKGLLDDYNPNAQNELLLQCENWCSLIKSRLSYLRIWLQSSRTRNKFVLLARVSVLMKLINLLNKLYTQHRRGIVSESSYTSLKIITLRRIRRLQEHLPHFDLNLRANESSKFASAGVTDYSTMSLQPWGTSQGLLKRFRGVYITFFLYFSLIQTLARARNSTLHPLLSGNKSKNSLSGVPKQSPTYKLMFNFKKHYLYVTLLSSKRRRRRRTSSIFFSLNTGLFLKFFNYKKSLKKTKSLKLILMRYLRKLLIVSKINNFNLYVKKTSDQLNKLIQILQKPLNHAFTDPITGKLVDEELPHSPNILFNFVYVIFLKSKPYGQMRIRNEGRLKRKIRRRVIKLNRIID